MHSILKILALACLFLCILSLSLFGEDFNDGQQMGVGIAAAFVVLGGVIIWATPEEES